MKNIILSLAVITATPALVRGIRPYLRRVSFEKQQLNIDFEKKPSTAARPPARAAESM
jgi:hypothetical protein